MDRAADAYRRAPPGPLRYEAARVAAEASYALGRPGRAQLWLRRVAQAATRRDLRDAAAGVHARIAAERPLSTELRFHVAPSSNINRGSSADVLIIDGVPTPFVLSEDAQALSGVEIAAQGALRYRILGSPTARTDVGLSFSGTTYMLSDSAKAAAPDVSGSDFAYATVEVALRQLYATEEGTGPWMFELAAGGIWYGGELLGEYARIAMGKSLRFSERLGATVEVDLERHWRDATEDSTVLGFEALFARRAGNGDLFEFGFDANDIRSSNRNLESSAVGGHLTWHRTRPIFGEVTVSTTISAVYRDYPVFFSNFFNLTGRQDLTVGGSVEFAFPELGAYGFAPTLTLRASETNSNISRYQQTNYGIAFGIRSVF